MTPTSRAILGLLSIVPMSGYDLVQAADAAVGRFWPVSKSQVYAELARLEPLGLVRGTEIAQERRPDKRVFRLTGRGEEALDAWLESADRQRPGSGCRSCSRSSLATARRPGAVPRICRRSGPGRWPRCRS